MAVMEDEHRTCFWIYVALAESKVQNIHWKTQASLFIPKQGMHSCGNSSLPVTLGTNDLISGSGYNFRAYNIYKLKSNNGTHSNVAGKCEV